MENPDHDDRWARGQMPANPRSRRRQSAIPTVWSDFKRQKQQYRSLRLYQTCGNWEDYKYQCKLRGVPYLRQLMPPSRSWGDMTYEAQRRYIERRAATLACLPGWLLLIESDQDDVRRRVVERSAVSLNDVLDDDFVPVAAKEFPAEDDDYPRALPHYIPFWDAPGSTQNERNSQDAQDDESDVIVRRCPVWMTSKVFWLCLISMLFLFAGVATATGTNSSNPFKAWEASALVPPYNQFRWGKDGTLWLENGPGEVVPCDFHVYKRGEFGQSWYHGTSKTDPEFSLENCFVMWPWQGSMPCDDRDVVSSVSCRVFRTAQAGKKLGGSNLFDNIGAIRYHMYAEHDTTPDPDKAEKRSSIFAFAMNYCYITLSDFFWTTHAAYHLGKAAWDEFLGDWRDTVYTVARLAPWALSFGAIGLYWSEHRIISYFLAGAAIVVEWFVEPYLGFGFLFWLTRIFMDPLSDTRAPALDMVGHVAVRLLAFVGPWPYFAAYSVYLLTAACLWKYGMRRESAAYYLGACADLLLGTFVAGWIYWTFWYAVSGTTIVLFVLFCYRYFCVLRRGPRAIGEFTPFVDGKRDPATPSKQILGYDQTVVSPWIDKHILGLKPYKPQRDARERETQSQEDRNTRPPDAPPVRRGRTYYRDPGRRPRDSVVTPQDVRVQARTITQSESADPVVLSRKDDNVPGGGNITLGVGVDDRGIEVGVSEDCEVEQDLGSVVSSNIVAQGLGKVIRWLRTGDAEDETVLAAHEGGCSDGGDSEESQKPSEDALDIDGSSDMRFETDEMVISEIQRWKNAPKFKYFIRTWFCVRRIPRKPEAAGGRAESEFIKFAKGCTRIDPILAYFAHTYPNADLNQLESYLYELSRTAGVPDATQKECRRLAGVLRAIIRDRSLPVHETADLDWDKLKVKVKDVGRWTSEFDDFKANDSEPEEDEWEPYDEYDLVSTSSRRGRSSRQDDDYPDDYPQDNNPRSWGQMDDGHFDYTQIPDWMRDETEESAKKATVMTPESPMRNSTMITSGKKWAFPIRKADTHEFLGTVGIIAAHPVTLRHVVRKGVSAEILVNGQWYPLTEISERQCVHEGALGYEVMVKFRAPAGVEKHWQTLTAVPFGSQQRQVVGYGYPQTAKIEDLELKAAQGNMTIKGIHWFSTLPGCSGGPVVNVDQSKETRACVGIHCQGSEDHNLAYPFTAEDCDWLVTAQKTPKKTTVMDVQQQERSPVLEGSTQEAAELRRLVQALSAKITTLEKSLENQEDEYCEPEDEDDEVDSDLFDDHMENLMEEQDETAAALERAKTLAAKLDKRVQEPIPKELNQGAQTVKLESEQERTRRTRQKSPPPPIVLPQRQREDRKRKGKQVTFKETSTSTSGPPPGPTAPKVVSAEIQACMPKKLQATVTTKPAPKPAPNGASPQKGGAPKKA